MLRAALPVLMLLLALPASATERRCGWLHNPTPANWWLDDRDGRWVLSVQGPGPVDGFFDLPDLTTQGWVARNGSYGYGCGCIVMETDRAARRVLRVVSGEALPLARCERDRSLPDPRR